MERTVSRVRLTLITGTRTRRFSRPFSAELLGILVWPVVTRIGILVPP